jgi:peptide deformylase
MQGHYKMQIITDETILRQKSIPATPEKAQEILSELRKTLRVVGGCGLSAPQIGIFKTVALVWDQEEIPLINPVIIDQYDPIINKGEGCLSFPNVRFDTNRFNYVVVKDDLHPEGIILEELEAIVAQHEIEHLSGILFFDRKIAYIKTGRNDPCPECLKEGITIKYKKCSKHFILSLSENPLL